MKPCKRYTVHAVQAADRGFVYVHGKEKLERAHAYHHGQQASRHQASVFLSRARWVEWCSLVAAACYAHAACSLYDVRIPISRSRMAV